MKVSRLLINICLIVSFNAFAFSDTIHQPFEYSFPETLPEKYKVDAKKLYLSLLPRNATLLSNKLNQRYTEAIAFDKKYLIENGFVYIGWLEMEEYLNAILQRIMPDSLRSNPFIHVYPSRLTDANAFCFGDGTILFNIGLFASIKDEAGIAIILGHELAHYINNDAVNVFVRNTEQHSFLHDMLPSIGRWANLQSLEYSREEEQIADQTGFELAHRAGYDVSSALHNFSIFSLKGKAANKYIESDAGETLIEKYSTHPLLEKRTDQLNRFLKSGATGGQRFIMEEEKFHLLKVYSSHECINLSLSRMDYENAMESSFIRLLAEPQNPVYAYYTSESIRRYTYLFKNKKEDPFLGYLLKTSADKNIFKHLFFLYPDTAFVKYALNQESLSGLRQASIITYDQMYDYCIQLALKHNKESYLSAALYYYNDSIRKDSLIHLYLSHQPVRQAGYARALFKDNPQTELKSKSLVIFSHLQFSERTFSGEYTDYFKSQTSYPAYATSLKSMLSTYFPEKNFISFDSVFLGETHNYFTLLETKMMINELEHYHLKDIDLFMLNSDLWHYHNTEGIGKLEFLSVEGWTNNRKYTESALLYVFLPVVLLTKGISNIVTGPTKYYYEINVDELSMDQQIQAQKNYIKVKYRLRESNFINSVYHVLRQKTLAAH